MSEPIYTIAWAANPNRNSACVRQRKPSAQAAAQKQQQLSPEAEGDDK
jgi:hypothetical protein